MSELKELDFYEIAKRLLISQYHKPNFLDLFKVMSKIFTEVQIRNFQLKDKFWLEDAVGEQLDFIGLLWDVSRGNFSDEKYRTAIYQKIGTTSSGTIQDIKTLLKQAYDATYANYEPEYPAQFRINTDAEITAEELQAVSPSGVLGLLYCYLVDYNGDYIVDANGNRIGSVGCGVRAKLVTTDGDQLVTTDGDVFVSSGYFN